MIQTDVMVIGGGPAGMNAALAQLSAGHRSYWLINFRNLVSIGQADTQVFWLGQRGAGTRGFNLAKQLAAQVNVKPNIKTLLGYESSRRIPRSDVLAASWRIT